MRKFLCVFVASMLVSMAWAQQTSLRGSVRGAGTDSPIVGAKVSLINQNISTTTNQQGEFSLIYLEAINEEVIISANNYLTQVKVVNLVAGQENDLGVIALKEDIQTEMKQEVILQLSENELNDDEGRTQNMSTGTSARNDVFTSHISYAFSPMRFRVRGYDQEFETTYINGINFNSQERGNFNYSMLGGLNDASRNKDVANGIEANSFAYGGIGTSTNIMMQASQYARGWKVGLAGTNRNYKGRVNATYSTGLMENGWAVTASAAWRYSPYINQKGIIGEGIFYNSAAYFLSVEKRLGDDHRLSLVTFGAPTQRAQSAAVTQEVYDLTGSINYNPYWGYHNGQMRNSRIVKSFDPTAILSHEWKIDEKSSLKTGVGFHYSMYSNSAITFYNAPDPRPDYYRNLPDFLFDGQVDQNGYFVTTDQNGVQLGGAQSYNGRSFGPTVDADAYAALTDLWTSRNNLTTQINWDNLYAANAAQNETDPNGSASYILERRHNDIMETALNSLYTNQLTNHLKLAAGLEAKYSKGIHYKTVDDLMGGNQWIDVDPFAERDIAELATNIGMTQAEIEMVKRNDIEYDEYGNLKAAKSAKNGDVFGYNYDINIYKVALFAQNEWNFNQVDFYYALKGTFSTFNRFGHMENGRAVYLAKVIGNQAAAADIANAQDYKDYYNALYISKGQGYSHTFIDPSLKAGVTYKINGRNRLKANVLAETRAPLARNAYISQRIHDRTIDSLRTTKVLSYDLTYEFNFPVVRGRITGFRTHLLDGSELNGYYDDEARTFVNQALSNINRIHQGVEVGAAVKLGTYFTLSAAASITDNHYTTDAYSVTSAENGMSLGKDISGNSIFELRDSVLINGLKVANGPQLGASLKLSFFHPKMWFADITVSYFDWNYLDFAPSRRMQALFTGKRADGTSVKYTSDNNSNYQSWYKTEQTTIVDENGIEKVVPLIDKNGHPVVSYPYNVLSDQESLVDANVLNRFLVDVSIGKLIYLKNRQSLSINLSVSNLLNNTHLKTGGYQQARLPRQNVQGSDDKTVITGNVWKFPAKYYYAWGTNFFLNLSYKF